MKFLITILLLLSSLYAWAGERWYADPNIGVAGGVPHDFHSRMNDLSKWKRALNKIDVYYLRLSSVRKINDDQLRHLANILKQYNIKTAVDDGAATWAHGGRKKANFSPSIHAIKRLQRLGFNVKYIGLQSVLSKLNKKFPKYRNLGDMMPRYKDILEYYKQVGKAFSGISIGIIDALPAKLPQTAVKRIYATVANGLKQRGHKLGFIHLDQPVSYARKRIRGNSWAGVVSLSKYVQDELKTDFGMMLVSNIGGKVSGKESLRYIKHGLHNYLKAGLKADRAIQTNNLFRCQCYTARLKDIAQMFWCHWFSSEDQLSGS